MVSPISIIQPFPLYTSLQARNKLCLFSIDENPLPFFLKFCAMKSEQFQVKFCGVTEALRRKGNDHCP